MTTSRAVSAAEEIANALTHGVGFVASLIGMPILVLTAMQSGERATVIGMSVFGATLIALYAASTFYHAVPHPVLKQRLRVVDHAAIYRLIAGTYTPFMLLSLGGTLGWGMLALIWTLAVAGVVARLWLNGRRHGWVVGLYVAMGWAVVLAIKPLVAALGTGGVALLAAGGVSYTLGVAFYQWRSLPYSHAIWHLFVLAGSALHFFAVLLYVLPG